MSVCACVRVHTYRCAPVYVGSAETFHWLVPASFLRSEISLTLELTLKARITDACYTAWLFMECWVSRWSLYLYGMHYQLSCLPTPRPH